MKDRLIDTLTKIVDLLMSCGEQTRAQWFRDRLVILKEKDANSAKFAEVIIELQGVLSGMGSLSDLSLSPTPLSGLTRQEARNRQWGLVEDLDDAIRSVLVVRKSPT